MAIFAFHISNGITVYPSVLRRSGQFSIYGNIRFWKNNRRFKK